MTVRVSSDWTFQDFPVVRLENSRLRVDLLPDFGGKILQIEHLGLDRKFLWHNPRQRLRRLPLGASYDDHFFGGWDELLPNDMPETANGERLVDHGELWTTPLAAHPAPGGVALRGMLPITPLRFEKRVTLRGAGAIDVAYRIENLGRKPLDLLFKVHPALRISPGAEIRVPARRAGPGDPGFSRFAGPFAWPRGRDKAGKALRGDVVPGNDGTCEFLYLTGLRRGACALAHRAEDWRFELAFDPRVFRSAWLFASYGGWRELEVAILEPCTTWPISLEAAAKAGQCLRLGPGKVLNTTVTCRVGRYGR